VTAQVQRKRAGERQVSINRIVAAGPTSEVGISSGTKVIDTRGETMMPGMIELHAHLVRVGDGVPYRNAERVPLVSPAALPDQR
jgi:predicted amidohydrolase YtcJ